MAITTGITLLTPLKTGLEIQLTQAPGGAASHDGDLHYGWDFVSTTITNGENAIFEEDVLAVADGFVEFVLENVPNGDLVSGSLNDPRDPSLGPSGALGNVVTLRHGVDGQTFYSSYFHLSQNSVPVSVGDFVSAGQTIGAVGRTGTRLSDTGDGTHLHLSIGEAIGSFFGGYPKIALGPEDGGRLLRLIDFADSPVSNGELPTLQPFTSSTTTGRSSISVVFEDDFERANSETIGNGWEILAERTEDGIRSDGRLLGTATLAIQDNALATRYVAHAEDGFRHTSAFEQPFMAHELGQDLSVSGFQLEFEVTAGDNERVRQFVGLFDEAAGVVRFGGFDNVVVPHVGIALEVLRSDDQSSRSWIKIFRFEDGNEFGLEDPNASQLIAEHDFSFSLEEDAPVDFAFTIDDEGGYTLSASDGTSIDSFSGSAGSLSSPLTSVFAAGNGSLSFFGDSVEIVQIGELTVSALRVSNSSEMSGGFAGLRLNGIDAQDYSGVSVSGAGDINGDGFGDLLIGANGGDPNGNTNAGESYIVFGKASGIGAVLDLSDLDGSNGFSLNGIDGANANSPGDQSGSSVSAAGDVNGDGFDDVLISATRGDPNGVSDAGESYVVFGKASGFNATLSLSSLSGTNGYRLDGIDTNDKSGTLSAAGDVNGDGFDDVIIGVLGGDPNGVYGAGESYVVFGKASGNDAELNLEILNGANGFRIEGINRFDQSGSSVSAAGDINADGFDDVIIGARFADPNGHSAAGESYVVFGKASAFDASLNLATLDGTNGFRLEGIDESDRSGISVSAAGDVNGDGFDDVIIGADSADPNGYSIAGESYVVFGKASGFDAVLNLSSLNGTNGFRIDGIDASDGSGGVVSAAGDVNGDGFDDVIVGAIGAAPNGAANAGESYIVFGKASDFNAVLSLSALDGTNGFRLNGVDTNDSSGFVSGAGDVNGDGFDDIIIGVPYADPNGVYAAGESYVVFGGHANLVALDVADGLADGTISLANLGIPYAGKVPATNSQPIAPSEELIEYLARAVAYRGGSIDQVFDVGSEVVDAKGDPSGYKIDKAFVLPLGFVAIGLISADPLSPVEPVLVIRGSSSGIDWLLANTDPSGIGYEQVLEAWEASSPSVRAWLEEQSGDGAHLTGHSLGGVQAQTLAALATGAGIPIASLTTFNSPGASAAIIADNLDSTLLGSVSHHISSGDIVSMAGETYIDGTVNLYDFESFNPFTPLLNTFNHFKNSHTGHWTDQSLYGSIYDQDSTNGPDGRGPAGPLMNYTSSSTTINSAKLSNGNYSYLDVGGSFDKEYLGALYYVALSGNILGSGLLLDGVSPALGGIPFLGSSIAHKLSTREGTESLRTDIGILERLFEALAIDLQDTALAAWNSVREAWSTFKEFSEFALGSIKGWSIEQWEGISQWSAEAWQFSRELPDMFWSAVSSWTSEKWDEVGQWTSETWSKLAQFSEEVWQASIHGAADVLRKIGEFPGELAELGADAWNAMADWTEDQWSAVADWSADTWDKAKTFSADVWENTKGAAASFFDGITNTASGAINTTVENYNKTKGILENFGDGAVQGLDNFWDTANGFLHFRDNSDIEVVEANSGIAPAKPTSSAILIGVKDNTLDTLDGSNENDLFIPSSGDIVNLFGVSDSSRALRSLSAASSGAESHSAGSDYIIGPADKLDKVVVNGFENDDAIFVSGAKFAIENLSVSKGSAILDIDVDADGNDDSRITLNGDYELAEFALEAAPSGTFITYVGSLNTTTDPEPVDPVDPVDPLPVAPVDPQAPAGPTQEGDNLLGTAQNDTINALAGNDIVNGLAGDDLLIGGSGDDSLKGAAGDDRLRGSQGDDTVKGGGGVDDLKGNGGADVIRAGGGADSVNGGGGADVILGNGGADTLNGGGGKDSLNGGGGADNLNGGGGADTLRGNGGDDTLKGNGGADVFQFRTADRNDTIADFRQGQDRIEIQNGANSFEALRIEQDGRDVLIGFGAAGQVRVVTDDASAFDESDFIF